MLFNLRRKLKFMAFDRKVRSVLDTQPVELTDDSRVICVSHVCRTYLYAYILAIKSMARHVPLRKIYVVDDLSLTDENKTLLKQQIKGIEILPITGIRNEYCPSGGDWEGFLLIGEQSKDSFCVLLDADTLTMKHIPEVVESITRNASFTLGTWANQKIGTAEETRESVKNLASDHVQILSEKNLDKLENAQNLKYVRGCGGFAGFAQGSLTREDIEAFSTSMKRIVGAEKWSEWGSQQVASNFFIAQTPDAVVLPFPKYASYKPDVQIDKSSFLHFIGTYRFDNGAYVSAAASVIEALPKPG